MAVRQLKFSQPAVPKPSCVPASTPTLAAFPPIRMERTASMVLMCSFNLGLCVPTPSLPWGPCCIDCLLPPVFVLSVSTHQHFIMLKHFLSSFYNSLSNPSPKLYHSTASPLYSQTLESICTHCPFYPWVRGEEKPRCLCLSFLLTSLSQDWTKTFCR